VVGEGSDSLAPNPAGSVSRRTVGRHRLYPTSII